MRCSAATRRASSAAADDLEAASGQLTELNLGATAVGTGLNASDATTRKRRSTICGRTRSCRCSARRICFASRRAWATSRRIRARCARLSIELGKIASDLRLLSMGPRAGLSEIALPAVQPGSSIMPGKVNPSIPEMVNQVCYQVMGCDVTVAMACRGRPARAERDDAGDCLERAALIANSPRGHDGASNEDASRGSRLMPGARASCSIAARPSPRR